MTDLVGQTINQYQILEHLGGGGMAYVYKAYHPGLDVHRAIKVIRPEFANRPGFKERFQREARAVAQLRHPNIVQVHDYGSQDDFYYMVMEFIEGYDLKDMLRRDGAIRPFSQVAEIIEQVASTLNYAHEKGVLHRDIKPANIMLTPQKQAILTDFGIAKILDQEAETGQTETGVSIGTPAYMAPEQAQGSPGIGPTADIYSLGIVLYEMLTGRVPFSADTPLAVILKVVNDPMPAPRTFSPDIPDVLQGVVLKATAKNPADRYQSAAAFIDGLKRSLSADPGTVPDVPASTVEAGPDSSPKTKAGSRKRTGWLAGGAIGLILLLCVVVAAAGAGIYYFTRPAPSLATWQFIIDASAGMNEAVDGRPKIDIARAALDKELRILPENVNAGLRIYGGQESGLEPCQDTKLLVEPATGRNGQIVSSLAGVTPQGEAPLTEAIVQAVSDFDLSQDTKNSLIIITSGLDTCETEAIDQLETLSRRLGIEVDLHLIGLGVQDNTDTEQLQELAQAAGGDYYAADNEEEIGRVLRDQISILQGTPVAKATATPVPQNTATLAPTATTGAPSLTPEPVSLNLVNVSDTPDGNSTEAQIMFDGQGYLHLAWVDQVSEDTKFDLLHRYLSPDGNWSEPENLTTDYKSIINSSPRLARSPNGDVCAFFAGAGPSDIAQKLYSSCFNGAATAETTLVQDDWRDASPAFDPNGVPHTTTIVPAGTLVFGEVEIVSGRTFLAYQPTFTIDQAGNYHAVWVLQADPFRLEYSMSTDGGQSWTEPEPLTGEEDPSPGWPQLVADEQGNVHLGWMGFGGRNFYRRWTPAEGWGETVEVGPDTQGSAWFDLVVDGDGLAHMVWIWTELTYAHQQADGSWTTPQVIFDDPGPASSGRPVLAIATNDSRHFVWVGKDKDIYYASLPAQ